MKAKTTKKIVSILLTFAMFVSMFTMFDLSMGTVSAAGETKGMLQMQRKAWQYVYQQILVDFEPGANYRFSADVFTYAGKSTFRLDVHKPGQDNAVTARFDPTVDDTSHHYSVDFTAPDTVCTSGERAKIQIFTRDDYTDGKVSDFIAGNISIYKLNGSGNPTGDNMVKDPEMNTGLSSDTWSSSAKPWYSNGSTITAGCRFVTQPNGVFDSDSTGDRLLTLHDCSWGYVRQQITNNFTANARYRFSADAYAFVGTTTIILKVCNSSNSYETNARFDPTPNDTNHHYTVDFTAPASVATSGERGILEIFTRDNVNGRNPYIALANVSVYKLDGSNNPTGDNLVNDSQFFTNMSTLTYSTGQNPWYSSLTKNTNYRQILQPKDYFESFSTGKRMIKMTGTWKTLATETGVTLTAGQRYRFTTYAKYIGVGESDPPSIDYKIYDTSGGDNNIRKWVKPSQSSDDLSFDFTAPANPATSGTTVHMRAMLRGNYGTLYIGNIGLYKIDGSGNIISDNLFYRDNAFLTDVGTDSWSSGNYPYFQYSGDTASCPMFLIPKGFFGETEVAKNTLRVEAQDSWANLLYEPILKPGTKYRLSYNVKSNTIGTTTASLQYKNTGGSITSIPGITKTEDSTYYKKYHTFTMPSDANTTTNNLKLRFYMGGNPDGYLGGVTYYSNIELYELDSGDNPIGQNQILNGGFNFGEQCALDLSGSGERLAKENAMSFGWYLGSNTINKAELISVPDTFFNKTVKSGRALFITGGDWKYFRSDATVKTSTTYQVQFNYRQEASAMSISLQQVDASGNFSSVPATIDDYELNGTRTYTFTTGSSLRNKDNLVFKIGVVANAIDDADIIFSNLECYEKSGNSLVGNNLFDNGDFALGSTGVIDLNNVGNTLNTYSWSTEGTGDFTEASIIDGITDDSFINYSLAHKFKYIRNTILGIAQTVMSIQTDLNNNGQTTVHDYVRLKNSLVAVNPRQAADTAYSTLNTSIKNAPNTLSEYNTYYLGKVTGTTYYISKSQGFSNISSSLKSGDAVLFERGGTYRIPTGSNKGYQLKAGVVYGSYGTGEKPLISGSAYDYKNRTWTSSGTNIWYTNVNTSGSSSSTGNDVGNVYFNNGKYCGVMKSGTSALTSNGDFYYNGSGRLYLYCTSDPRSYYSNIEIAQNKVILGLADNVVIDNLDIRYGGLHGISGTADSVNITNCNISWIGGAHQDDARLGNGIQISQHSDWATVKYCHISQCYDAGLTFQSYSSSGEQPGNFTNITFQDNIVEYCTYGIEMFSSDHSASTGASSKTVDNIHILGNVLRYSGYGWGNEQRYEPGSTGDYETAHIRVGQMRYWPSTTKFEIKNNYFDISLKCMVFWRMGKTVAQPGLEISGNYFYQTYGKTGDYRAIEFGIVGNPADPDNYLSYASSQYGLNEAVARFDSSPADVKWVKSID